MSVLEIIIALPLLAALAVWLGAPARAASLGATFVNLALVLYATVQYAAKPAGLAFTNARVVLENPAISFAVGADGVSLILALLTSLVMLAAVWQIEDRPNIFYISSLLIGGGALGAFLTTDVFFIYAFHELALIPTFIMVGIWGGRDRNYAAMKLTIYLTAGAMLSLLGLIALYVKSGANSFDLIELKDAIAAGGLRGSTQNWIGGLLLLGFGTLVSLWPLHTWAPLGYGAAPSSAAMLHAGVLKKFGLYGLIQIAIPLIPLGLQHWAWKLALLAAFGNVLVVGFVTMAQRDLKQMLGYSSVMHMGYCFLGIACLSTIGTGGVVLLMVAHGLSVALLFLLATSIHHRTHTFDLSEMGGLAQKTPVLAAFFVAATMASIGLPGFANFWGELTVFVAVWKFSPALTAVAVAGVVISAIYGLRATARVFFGPASEQLQRVHAQHAPADLDWREKLPALILLAALLLFGFYPKAISQPVDQALNPAQATHTAPAR